jgi:hypothetical protein
MTTWAGAVVVLVVMQRRWKYPQWGDPGAATVSPPVKSSLGRAWLATQALPRHASQVSTWAIGECDCLSSHPLPSTLPLPQPLATSAMFVVLCLWPGYVVLLVSGLLDYYIRIDAAGLSFLLWFSLHRNFLSVQCTDRGVVLNWTVLFLGSEMMILIFGLRRC